MTHAELVEAVEAALLDTLATETDRRAHLDTLQAILDLHDDIECQVHCANPCHERTIVVDALRNMGALT